MGASAEARGPDFSAGFPRNAIPRDGTISGHVGDSAVLLSRFDGELFAVSGTCTHYGAALDAGLLDGPHARCPLHHACFDLRTGAVLRAPALDGLARWKVEIEGEKVFVRDRIAPAPAVRPRASADVERVVIVGGGAAGLACASELRRLGHAGAITLLSAEQVAPYDRPNLSKDYLAGTAPEEWLPLRGDDWYAEQRIALRLGIEAERVDVSERRVHAFSGEEFPFDRLLIATGSEPNRLRGPGFESDDVFTLRSLADVNAIASRARPGARAVIVGSSFIGLEAAAALRKRGVELTIASAEAVPFEGVFGRDIGKWFQDLQERNGIGFELGTAASGFDQGKVNLTNGQSIEADFLVVGIGVRPRLDLAESAALKLAEGGVKVDRFLETSEPGIFAAGDIAAYPDPLTGEQVRTEHWVVAERQGQAAAANMLGLRRDYVAIPFFWTEQHDVSLRYVGRAARWDSIEVDGSLESRRFIARFYDRGTHCASAAVGRDLALLEDEREFEARIAKARPASAEPEANLGIQCAATTLEE